MWKEFLQDAEKLTEILIQYKKNYMLVTLLVKEIGVRAIETDNCPLISKEFRNVN